MFGVMEYGMGVGGRSMGSAVCFIGFVGDEFRDRPARGKSSLIRVLALLPIGIAPFWNIMVCVF